MHRKSRQTRRPLVVVVSALAALILVIGAVSLSPATAESGLSPLELARVTQANCQVLLAKATTSAARTRARACVADQQVIIDALAPSGSPSATQSPSPSPSPTVQPSPSVSPTATTPPMTTPPATTPPPSPSPTGTLTNCVGRLAACGYPNAGNTGVPAGTALIVVQGNVTLSTAGMVYENKDVRGCIAITAAGVTIRNVRITCVNWWGILNQQASGARSTIEDVEVNCASSNGTGIGYVNLDVHRVYVHDCENGFSIDHNVTVEDSYVPNTFNGNGAHGDAIQVAAPAANLVVRHNTLFAQYGTAAFNWTDPTQSILVELNFLGGGSYVVYCPRVTVAVGSFRVLNNRFADGMETYGLSDSCNGGDVIWLANYRDSNLTTVAA